VELQSEERVEICPSLCVCVSNSWKGSTNSDTGFYIHACSKMFPKSGSSMAKREQECQLDPLLAI
jgi:hypothetical protein